MVGALPVLMRTRPRGARLPESEDLHNPRFMSMEIYGDRLRSQNMVYTHSKHCVFCPAAAPAAYLVTSHDTCSGKACLHMSALLLLL